MSQVPPMDPALRRFLDESASAGPPATAAEARDRMVRALASRASIPGLPDDAVAREIELRPGLAARLYTPPRAAAAVLVYFHGGGWVAGSLATHDPFCRLLCAQAGVLVLAVDYRLAPEHPYPAAVEDALAATDWAFAHAAELGAARVALGGDSAGGNLAAVAANRTAALQREKLAALLLLYPVTDHYAGGHASYRENAVCCGLTAEGMRWFWDQYAPGVDPRDPAVSPLHCEPLPALPPTLVATAGYDVLRDEGLRYADRLEATGIAVTRLHAADMHHDFPVSPGTVERFPQCSATLAAVAAWLRATLEPAS